MCTLKLILTVLRLSTRHRARRRLTMRGNRSFCHAQARGNVWTIGQQPGREFFGLRGPRVAVRPRARGRAQAAYGDGRADRLDRYPLSRAARGPAAVLKKESASRRGGAGKIKRYRPDYLAAGVAGVGTISSNSISKIRDEAGGIPPAPSSP